MKNSARTFVAWNFLTSDAAKSLPRIGNSDYISELSCSGMHARAPGYYTLREHSARASSQERFTKKKGAGRGGEKGREVERTSETLLDPVSCLPPPFSSYTAFVSRFCVNDPLLKRPGNQIRINGPSPCFQGFLPYCVRVQGSGRSIMRLEREKKRN